MSGGVENAEIGRLFRETADLLELQEANPFRVRAYRTAARTVAEQAEPVALLALAGNHGLEDLPGIGGDLAGKIREVVRTGHLRILEELRHQVPAGLVELTRLRGIGPKKAVRLAEALGIGSLAQLENAARKGQIAEVPGFGPKTEARILRELGAKRSSGARVPRATAAQYGETLVEYLGQLRGTDQVEIAGSYRRRQETVGDLDVLVTCRAGTPVVDRFVAYPEATEILTRGETGASVRLASGLQVDLRVLAPENFGAGLYYFTGSKAHNIAVRRLAQRRGLRINEYGVFRRGRRVSGRTETEVAAAVGLPWIPPELREDRGEIEAARRGRLPVLVDLDDLRGDLQVHTTASDGRDDLATMVRAAEALGHEYLAVTDHSPAVRVATGLDRDGLRRQRRAIDRLNSGSRRLTVLAGVEVDILGDGTLDLDHDTLAGLDVVVAAVHSKFDLPPREQTRRLVRAIRNPDVGVIAHPAARLIGERPPLRFDLDVILRAAAEHGVLLEVNAQPSRLDLDDLAVRAAIEAGVELVIDSDAHSTAELRFLRWGVDQARRGWATPADVVNTRPVSRVLSRLRRGG